jgi:hypothetical protein
MGHCGWICVAEASAGSIEFHLCVFSVPSWMSGLRVVGKWANKSLRHFYVTVRIAIASIDPKRELQTSREA